MTRLVVEVFQKLMSKDIDYQALDRSIDDYSRQIKIFAESLLALLMLLVSMPIILIAMVLVRITSRPRHLRAEQVGSQRTCLHDLQDSHDVS